MSTPATTPGTGGRRSFAAALKLQAVRLACEQKIPGARVCRDFNISSSSLHRWSSQYDAERSGQAGPGAPITSGQRRIRELERERRQLHQDVESLKKASALFARGLALIHRWQEEAHIKAAVTRLACAAAASMPRVQSLPVLRGPSRRAHRL